MTREKAQKRAVRARMAKTGERYTTARLYHLDLHRQPGQDTIPASERPSEPDSQPEAEVPRSELPAQTADTESG